MSLAIHRKTFASLTGLAFVTAVASAEPRPQTFCNPIDLPYRFSMADNEYAGGKTFREAADPIAIYHGGSYWLFASKVGGYFRSRDMVDWEFIETTGFPVEGYAPSVVVAGGKWLMTHSIGDGALHHRRSGHRQVDEAPRISLLRGPGALRGR